MNLTALFDWLSMLLAGIGDTAVCGFNKMAYPFLGGQFSDVHFMYYTRDDPKTSCDLQPTKEALSSCKFNGNANLTVVMHGTASDLLISSPVFDIKDKLLDVGYADVVVFNWSRYTTNIQLSITNSFFMSMTLANWFQFLMENAGLDLGNVHVIGHSLAAELTHYTTLMLCKRNLFGHVTYLDASAFEFRFTPKFLQPSPDDGHFVTNMHTSAALLQIVNGFGYVNPMADLDFYPNGGNDQPNCQDPNAVYVTATGRNDTASSTPVSYVTCSHDSAFAFYLASFDPSCVFRGRICDSYDKYKSGDCSSNLECRMGFYEEPLPVPPKSKCYLETSAQPPYCLN